MRTALASGRNADAPYKLQNPLRVLEILDVYHRKDGWWWVVRYRSTRRQAR